MRIGSAEAKACTFLFLNSTSKTMEPADDEEIVAQHANITLTDKRIQQDNIISFQEKQKSIPLKNIDAVERVRKPLNQLMLFGASILMLGIVFGATRPESAFELILGVPGVLVFLFGAIPRHRVAVRSTQTVISFKAKGAESFTDELNERIS